MALNYDIFLKAILHRHDHEPCGTHYQIGLIEEKEKLVERVISPVTPLDDFPYKGIFQVSMKLLKQQTGLNFKWKGVTSIKVEESTTKLKGIDATETPSEARRGAVTLVPVNPINPLGFVLAG